MDDLREKVRTRWYNEFLICFDPLPIALAFYENKMLSKEMYRKISYVYQNGNERGEICRLFLESLPREFSLSSILGVLRRNGYSKLANMLLSLVYIKESEITSVYRTNTQPGKAAHNHFRNIKRNIHNGTWQNPSFMLRWRADKFQDELQTDIGPIRRQCITDMLVAHLGAELDAISIKFDDQFFKHPIFSQLQNLYQNSTNALIPMIIYLSRQANAYAIGGNFQEGEIMLSDAMQCAFHLGPCLELVNLHYLDVVFQLWKLEVHHSRELKSSLINKAKTGLDLLQYENEDVQIYLTRMFFIRMASALLGIGNRGNVFQGYIIESKDILAAKCFLAEVDRLWKGIEIRQEMFYSVARAKIYHLNDDLHEAFVCVQRALKLAQCGNFKEEESIKEYYKELDILVNISNKAIPSESSKTSSVSNYPSSRGTSSVKTQNLDSTRCYVVEYDDSSVDASIQSSLVSTDHYTVGKNMMLSNVLEIEGDNLDFSSLLDENSDESHSEYDSMTEMKTINYSKT